MQARFFDETKNVCMLCPRHCKIPAGSHGFCRVRDNRNGQLLTRTYGEISACGIDPIEKKPLNHFLPGSATLSISSFGCNFTCKHCQNHTLSQTISCTTEYADPEDIVRIANQNQVDSISFTYNEPTVFYEYMYDVAKLAHASGLKTAIITNGYICEDPCTELAPYIDAFRIDLKAFSETFYQNICGNAHLQPVLDTIGRVAELKRHLELVTLIIPTLNDSPEELNRMLAWELETLGPAIPHHFTAFSPNYQLTSIPAADHAQMEKVFLQAKKAGLWYPYIGNVIHNEGSTTSCPSCNTKLIQRMGYISRMPGIENGHCKHCGRKIEGVF
ncbi:MAG TPA: AmmeMemoRadiSam system radical SAM enzyme [Methanocorpusculum sp.]|nr:AmmeMemoRadiSam system radical SAM enzyme [Methanocorpusculum sp.]